MMADALATVLMVLGPDAGLTYAREQNIAALLICREQEGSEGGNTGYRELASPALAAMLE
jgi:thiamine biosynthesis lipoprotein